MNFIMSVDAAGKKTLWPNRSNTPKEILRDKDSFMEIEVPMEKASLMKFIQEMLDRLPTDENIDTSDIPEATEEFFERANWVMPKGDNPEDMSEDNFRRLCEDRWSNQPLAWRLHMAALIIEDARDIINPAKYQRIENRFDLISVAKESDQ